MLHCLIITKYIAQFEVVHISFLFKYLHFKYLLEFLHVNLHLL